MISGIEGIMDFHLTLTYQANMVLENKCIKGEGTPQRKSSGSELSTYSTWWQKNERRNDEISTWWVPEHQNEKKYLKNLVK